MLSRILLLAFCLSAQLTHAADSIVTKSSYAERYGQTKGALTIDPKDLPRYPAVEPAQALSTWVVKPGYSLELAAHEPLVRDPIALSYDAQGALYACEMIDYSERRDVTPHLGRISRLLDTDSDGRYDKASVFADDLPWPTGVLCANGGIFVAATPDLWFFQDRDGDGKAEVRERIYTGFGTGLKVLNVQGMINCLNWHLDCRIHMQCGGGNRGKVKCLKRPELPEEEIAGRDFWFDPRTFEFGFTEVGAQYGMSFDTAGRKYACSNSDHLQHYPYEGRYGLRNPHFTLPPARRSVAVDGPAAEVFRISPDEPWRIIRTRLRVSGVLKGMVEGGGRVSGYFTGATGTTVYRGDAVPEWLDHTFTGDAGGQLIHHKEIAPDGISVKGQRPVDETRAELAASRDTWVRIVNFANAPDGSLQVCDMYRQVIEHPWSIGDEIKQHLDLNQGHDRGRIYRLVKAGHTPRRQHGGIGEQPLSKLSTTALVATLAHTNGWHRDTAARLLCERADTTAVPELRALFQGKSSFAKLHALGVLRVLNGLDATTLLAALKDASPVVREHGIRALEHAPELSDELAFQLKNLARDASLRVLLQLAFTLPELRAAQGSSIVDSLLTETRNRLTAAARDKPELAAALASAPPAWCLTLLHESLAESTPQDALAPQLLRIAGAVKDTTVLPVLANLPHAAAWLPDYAAGLKAGGSDLAKADPHKLLAAHFTAALSTLRDSALPVAQRSAAAQLLALLPDAANSAALLTCLSAKTEPALQVIAVSLLLPTLGSDLLSHWPGLQPEARESLLTGLSASPAQALTLLAAVGSADLPQAKDFSPALVQSLVRHKDAKLASTARFALSQVLPASREEVLAKFQPALELKGDSVKGQQQFMARCFACHAAKGQGMNVGPDLVTVKTRGAPGILEAILHPNKEVAPQFIACTVTLKDGKSSAGIITRDDARGMTLRMMGGLEQALARADIASTQSAGLSLMPEGLEQGMTPQDMADLLAFIEAL